VPASKNERCDHVVTVQKSTLRVILDPLCRRGQNTKIKAWYIKEYLLRLLTYPCSIVRLAEYSSLHMYVIL